ncbi:hypothetical protein PoB_005281000 [Plakobranchus ocellatus]|uniref:Uncharacterized protein n=1 Tax=Plakobranchus ocellatus TaxID=259542 RepID=A0AAV4C0X3_9GAST|nr:hypothetical protein PoB_005281000 [Plakobranchus ocellatus]
MLIIFLRREIGRREVDVIKDIGCEGVVVRKRLIKESQLKGIDSTALLAEKAVVNLRTSYLYFMLKRRRCTSLTPSVISSLHNTLDLLKESGLVSSSSSLFAHQRTTNLERLVGNILCVIEQ